MDPEQDTNTKWMGTVMEKESIPTIVDQIRVLQERLTTTYDILESLKTRVAGLEFRMSNQVGV